MGIVTKASVDATRSQIRLFFESLGLTGHGDPLSIVTDKEDAVSKLIRGTDLGGRHVNYVKAAPQGHQAVGGAERSVRTMHEGLAKLNLQLSADRAELCLSLSQCFQQAVWTAYACGRVAAKRSSSTSLSCVHVPCVGRTSRQFERCRRASFRESCLLAPTTRREAWPYLHGTVAGHGFLEGFSCKKHQVAHAHELRDPPYRFVRDVGSRFAGSAGGGAAY